MGLTDKDKEEFDEWLESDEGYLEYMKFIFEEIDDEQTQED